ncbi:MAG: hypothetical protein ABIS27_09105, partial [Longimicrobiales bacterium]
GGNVAGAVVTFAVVTGSGSVTGASVTTGADGIATIGSWTLGTVTGANTISASASGATALTFTATAAAGPAALVEKAAGDNQTATPGTAVAVAPSVRVKDAFGNLKSGASVAFGTVFGGGTIGGTSSTATINTDANGIATIVGWTLGSSGTNTLSASTSGATLVSFSATGTVPPPAPGFQIDIRFTSPMTTAQRAAFTNAGARWSAAITGDLSNVNTGSIPANACGNHPALVGEVIDDIIIFAQIGPIDGVSGILGQAGPCFTRTSNHLTVIGSMQFDEADMANLEANGTLGAVILHEMGHVLGIGTLWDNVEPFLLNGAGGLDPFFSGTQAKDRYTLLGATLVNGVPVENCVTGVPTSCGQGTRDAHWRESTFRTELMTGYLSGSGGTNPLSSMTIASLGDLGYTVNLAAADAYTLPTGSGFELASGPTLDIGAREKLLKPIGRIGPQ